MSSARIYSIIILFLSIAFIGADCDEVLESDHQNTESIAVSNQAKGPYVQNASQTAAQIVFENLTAQECEWGRTPELGNRQEAQFDPASSLNVCYLEQLEAGSLYYYRVIMDEEPLEGSFITEPDTEAEFSFLVLGDNRSGRSIHQEVVEAILEHNPFDQPEMLFNTGDMVYQGGKQSEWNAFFKIERELLSSTVFYPVVGNHDVIADLEADFNLWKTTGKFYHFKYANALFVVMDTEGWYELGSDQYEMVSAALLDAQTDPEIDFKFVFFHRPGVTTSKHGPDPIIVRDYLDLFEEYNVDVVFSGHNHNYEHSLINGVHYVVTGAAGAPLYSVRGGQEWSIKAEAVHHFCSVRVNPDGYDLVAVRRDGTLLDGFSGKMQDGGFPGPTPGGLYMDLELGCGIYRGGGNRFSLVFLLLGITPVQNRFCSDVMK